MRVDLVVLTVVVGVVLTVHLAMNGQVGSILQNPQMGNALFWCIGAATAILIGLTNWKMEFFSQLNKVPVYLFVAGALGASLVFGIAWLMPRVGAGPCMVVLLTGQIVSAMVLSHFGWLGSPVQPISSMKVLGAVVMVVGVCMITFARSAPS